MDFEFQQVDKIDLVPEQFRGIYEEKDGKFSVGESFQGVTTAVIGLNKSLKAARAEAKGKTAIDLSVLSDYGATPEEIKESVAGKITELQNEIAKGGSAKLNLDKVRQEMTAAHAQEMHKKEIRNDALQNQVYELLVVNNATAAIVEAKGDPDLLMPFIKSEVKIVEEDGKFNAYVVDAQGDRRYSGVTGQPMSMKDLVLEKKGNEKYGRLFESESPAGGGMQMIIMLALMFGVFYFFMIRPQMKKQKELKQFREALKTGANVVTIGGIHGTVSSIQEDTVLLKLEDKTIVKVEKSALITDFKSHQQQSGRK